MLQHKKKTQNHNMDILKIQSGFTFTQLIRIMN